MITGKKWLLIVSSNNGLTSELLKKERYVCRIMEIKFGLEILK
jgi:hypothetical protein